MAVPETSLVEKPRENMSKKTGAKEILLDHEIKLAKGLAANNRQTRDKALKSLRKWFQNPVNFGEDDFMRIWQGLFYSIWMSDKLLVQEEVVESIVNLIHYLENDVALLFFKCGLKTMMNRWVGIDQFRLDKYLMFVRRFLRHMLIYLKSNYDELIVEYNKVLEETILSKSVQVSLGLFLHFIDVYMEEYAKVYQGTSIANVELYLPPFVKYLAFLQDDRQINQIVKNIFRYLFRQSDLGIEYHEKFNAWKKLGFPGKSVHDIVKEEVDEDEEEQDDEENDSDDDEDDENSSAKVKKQNEIVLDPRAGSVNVELPQITFDAEKIIKMLESYKFAQGTCTKARRAIKKLISEFTLYSQGIYPLGMKPPGLKEKAPTENGIKSDKRKEKRKKKGQEQVENSSTTKLNSQQTQPSKPKKIKLDCADDESFCGTLKKNSGTWFVYEKKTDEATLGGGGGDAEEVEMPTKNKTKKKGKKRNRINAVSEEPVEKKLRSNLATENNVSSVSAAKSKPNKNQKQISVLDKKKALDKMVEQIINRNNLSPPSSSASLSSNNSRNKVPISPQTPKSVLRRATSTPGSSAKKVNINLKMNQSQEISEHYSQIKKSPGIPWDASKKPTKPLLKPFIQSPINPFYKRKFNL